MDESMSSTAQAQRYPQNVDAGRREIRDMTQWPTADAVLADWIGCETADVSEFMTMVCWETEAREKTS